MVNFSRLFLALRHAIVDRTYGSDLERYILSRHPQSAADIERYTIEYNKMLSRGGWL